MRNSSSFSMPRKLSNWPAKLVSARSSISPDERKIVAEVFDAGKRQIREVLVPRTEVVFLDAETPVEVAAGIAAGVPHSRLPVYQDSYDNVTGFVHVRDLLGPGVAKNEVPVGQISRPVKFLPISKTVLSSLSEMRREIMSAVVRDHKADGAALVRRLIQLYRADRSGAATRTELERHDARHRAGEVFRKHAFELSAQALTRLDVLRDNYELAEEVVGQLDAEREVEPNGAAADIGAPAFDVRIAL